MPDPITDPITDPWIDDYFTDAGDPTPDEQPQDKATCHFCGKGEPSQFFMEGFWAHDTCMDAQYDTPNQPSGGDAE